MFELDCPEPLAPGWHDVELELVESVGEPERRRVHAPVLVPAPDAEFAVVSDLDDTVIRTHANDALRELAIVFGKSAQSRSPMPCRAFPRYTARWREGRITVVAIRCSTFPAAAGTCTI